MFKLDDKFLTDLGLGALPSAEKNKMLAHIYETLEMRVGMKLAEKMSNEQLDEFESFIKSSNEEGALKWLEGNFPNYKQVVAGELEKLKVEIRKDAPQIVAQIASVDQQEPSSPAQPQQQTVPQPLPPQHLQQDPVVTSPAEPSEYQPVLNPLPPQQQSPQQAQAPTPQQPPVQMPPQRPQPPVTPYNPGP